MSDATTVSDRKAPWRKVAGNRVQGDILYELLECGHTVYRRYKFVPPKASRRRCKQCLADAGGK